MLKYGTTVELGYNDMKRTECIVSWINVALMEMCGKSEGKIL
jgi:hypothetical protein